MKHLTSVALALALAASAAAAQADPPDQNGQPDGAHGAHGGQHGGGGQGGGQHGAGAGGAVGGRGSGAPAAGPQFHAAPGGGSAAAVPFHAAPSAARSRGAWQGGGQPGQGQAGAFNGQGGGDHHEHHDWQGGGQAHGQPGAVNPNFQGGGQGRGGGGDEFAGRHFEGGHDHGGHAQPGFVPGNHPFRAQDRGRQWFNGGAFPHQFSAERRFHARRYFAPHGWYARSWGFGDFLPGGWYASDYYLDYQDYDLPPPPIGCEWVRVGEDALLVDVWTGEVLSVESGLFW
jgi:Ni/Co efflux regulator RcnB